MKICSKQLLFQKYIVILILICVASSINSCRKELPACTGNCSTIVFSGMIYDKTTSQPLSGQSVDVILHQNTYCLICSTFKVVSGKSDANGRFRMSKMMDTTLFNDNYLLVAVPIPDNYLEYPEPVGPGIIRDKPEYSNIRIDSFNLTAMGNLTFGFYPKTLLHINMHRTTPLILQYRDITLEFEFDKKLSGWGLEQLNTNQDTSLTINTSANIFTKITTRKFVDTSTVISKTDSIKCKLSNNNTMDFYY